MYIFYRFTAIRAFRDVSYTLFKNMALKVITASICLLSIVSHAMSWDCATEADLPAPMKNFDLNLVNINMIVYSVLYNINSHKSK